MSTNFRERSEGKAGRAPERSVRGYVSTGAQPRRLYRATQQACRHALVKDSPGQGPFRYLVANHRGLLLGALAFMGLTSLFGMAIPIVVSDIIDNLARAFSPGELLRHSLLIGLLAVLQLLVRIPSRLFVFYSSFQAERTLRGVLLARIYEMERRFFLQYRVGDIMSRLTNDLAALKLFFNRGMLELIDVALGYGVAVPMMLMIDPWLTPWALLPYPLLLVGTRVFVTMTYRYSREIQASLGSMTSRAREDLAGVQTIKAYRLQNRRSRGFHAMSRRYADLELRAQRWRTALPIFVAITGGISLITVLVVGGRRVQGGAMSMGDLVAFVLYVEMLVWPSVNAGRMLARWQQANAAWRRTRDIIEHPARARTEAVQPGPLPSTFDLEVEDLAVQYEDETILDRISFRVPQGTVCGVIGRVGSGKSTLAAALACLLAPWSGTVRIGGRDASALPRWWLRSQIAFVPQEPFLFALSMRENILMGLPAHVALGPDEIEQRLERAVRICQIAGEIERFPDGLATPVGERGHKLSRGQRQRIALARALVGDHSVVIMDDALSALDADTRRRLLDQMAEHLKDRTIVMTTHSRIVLAYTSELVVLDGGKLVARGPTEETLAQHGASVQTPATPGDPEP